MPDFHEETCCKGCVHLENEIWCEKIGATVSYTTNCTLREEEKKQGDCNTCAYFDDSDGICYITGVIPSLSKTDCKYLSWPVSGLEKNKPAEVKDLLPNQKALVGVTGNTPEKKEEKKEEKGTITYTTYSSYSKCHNGTILVFTDKKSGIDICGGGKMRDVVVKQDDLFIDVGYHYDKLIETHGLKKGWELEKYNKTSSLIKIDWSDGGHPGLSKNFWKELVKVIREEKKRVVISCQGGHGRTGTVLAILANLMSATKENEDPVKFIREKYCKEAVETTAQIKYIEDITKCKVEEKPSHSYGTTYYCGYGSSEYSGGNWWKHDKEEEKKEDKVTKTAINNLKNSGVYDLLI